MKDRSYITRISRCVHIYWSVNQKKDVVKDVIPNLGDASVAINSIESRMTDDSYDELKLY